jgi:hypothetical protein
MTQETVVLKVTPEFASTEHEQVVNAFNHLKRLRCGEALVMKNPDVRVWEIEVPKYRADIAAGVLKTLYNLNVALNDYM